MIPLFIFLVTIRCESIDFEREECPAGGRVRLLTIQRRLPDSEDCIQGATYGSYEDKIWVAAGCRAVFTVLVAGRCVCSRVIFLK